MASTVYEVFEFAEGRWDVVGKDSEGKLIKLSE
jgi:hypothetical protein